MSKIKAVLSKHKIISITVLVVLIAFLLLNCVWAIYHNMLFGSYEKITKNDRVAGACIFIKDDKTYSVSGKSYLSFKGNLSINDQQNKCFLLVWPSLSGEPEIGFSAEAYNFYIDTEGNLVSKEDDIAKQIYTENREFALILLNDYNEWTKAAENKDTSFFSDAK